MAATESGTVGRAHGDAPTGADVYLNGRSCPRLGRKLILLIAPMGRSYGGGGIFPD